MSHQITEVRIPAQRVLSVRSRVPEADVPEFVGTALNCILDAARRARCTGSCRRSGFPQRPALSMPGATQHPNRLSPQRKW